jgi:hypothetical protein
VVLGDAPEEFVETADAGLTDAEVADSRQNRDAHPGPIPVDGLWCEAFLGGDLVVVGVVRSRSLTFSARIAAGPVVSVASMSRVLPS